MKQTIKIKRAYEVPSNADGYRVYVDRLWPRGLSHATFHYDAWDKALAPSAELREWFHADPEERWPDFEARYRAELEANPALGALKNEIAGRPVVTLLYSSRDEAHNNAVVLASLLG